MNRGIRLSEIESDLNRDLGLYGFRSMENRDIALDLLYEKVGSRWRYKIGLTEEDSPLGFEIRFSPSCILPRDFLLPGREKHIAPLILPNPVIINNFFKGEVGVIYNQNNDNPKFDGERISFSNPYMFFRNMSFKEGNLREVLANTLNYLCGFATLNLNTLQTTKPTPYGTKTNS